MCQRPQSRSLLLQVWSVDQQPQITGSFARNRKFGSYVQPAPSGLHLDEMQLQMTDGHFEVLDTLLRRMESIFTSYV